MAGAPDFAKIDIMGFGKAAEHITPRVWRLCVHLCRRCLFCWACSAKIRNSTGRVGLQLLLSSFCKPVPGGSQFVTQITQSCRCHAHVQSMTCALLRYEGSMRRHGITSMVSPAQFCAAELISSI